MGSYTVAIGREGGLKRELKREGGSGGHSLHFIFPAPLHSGQKPSPLDLPDKKSGKWSAPFRPFVPTRLINNELPPRADRQADVLCNFYRTVHALAKAAEAVEQPREK